MFRTDIKFLDEKIGGGFPNNRVSAIFGSPNIGKSMMCVQCAINSLIEDKKVIYITSMSERDSEQYFHVFDDRYKDWIDKKDNIDFIYVSDLADLGDKFDYMLNINYSREKSDDSMGKASLIVKNQSSDTIRNKKNWKREYFMNYDLIIIDSLSELVKLDIMSDLANFPARSQTLTFLFAIFNDCMNDFNNTFLLTHHLTKSVIGYANASYLWGGASLGYLSKHIIEIDSPKKTAYDKFKKEGRSLKIYRWPGLQESEFFDVSLYKDWGYLDIDQYIEKTGNDPDKKKKRGRKKKSDEDIEIVKDENKDKEEINEDIEIEKSKTIEEKNEGDGI